MATSGIARGFRQRWRIKGSLHTLSPLFVGSGDTFAHPEIKKEDGKPAEVLAFTKAGGIPFIPGSTLKGCLRNRMEQLVDERYKSLFDALFGTGPEKGPGKDQGQGGKARFYDARLASRRVEPTPLPYWNPETQTFIEAHTCKDRVTGTCLDKMLFYQETVPAGLCFAVEITGRFGPGSTLSEKEVALLLVSLEEFSKDPSGDGLCLGGDTASGKGRLLWELKDVSVIDEGDVKKWIRDDACVPFCQDLYRPVGSGDTKRLLSIGKSLLKSPVREEVAIPITIKFDSHFLVNDPPSPSEVEKKKKDPDICTPDHRPLRDEMGRVLLPASSVRGALRGQAERIIRTMGGTACSPGTFGACRATDLGRDYRHLCPACRAFGAPGYRSPLRISDFRLADSKGEMTQELLAIDRFTGGGKRGAKFNIQAIFRPAFKGEIVVELGRLREIEKKGGTPDACWVLGLLALVLRDLIEGDITFGFGASKGYGSCRAEVGCWEDEQFRQKAVNGLKVFREMIDEKQREKDEEIST